MAYLNAWIALSAQGLAEYKDRRDNPNYSGPMDDVLYYAEANLSDTAGTVLCDSTYGHPDNVIAQSDTGFLAIGTAGNDGLVLYGDPNESISYDGANSVKITHTPVGTTFQRRCSRWSGSVKNVGFNGTMATQGTYDGNWLVAADNMYVGTLIFPAPFVIKNLIVLSSDLGDTDCATLMGTD